VQSPLHFQCPSRSAFGRGKPKNTIPFYLHHFQKGYVWPKSDSFFLLNFSAFRVQIINSKKEYNNLYNNKMNNSYFFKVILTAIPLGK
jgi:hypothetical protein